MTVQMQQTSPRMNNWVSLQQADTQTVENETESKSQMLNTQSSSLKVVRYACMYVLYVYIYIYIYIYIY